MSIVAVLGAGPLGAAIAHKLAERARVGAITLIDSHAGIATGKALDIQQSGPIGRYDTRLSGTSEVLAAASASVIVLADDSQSGEWTGDAALGIVRQLTRAGTTAPFVFAGPTQTPVMETAVRELRVPPNKLVGTAASGIASSVAALVAIEAGYTGVSVTVAGRPPELVILWSSATIAGSLLTDLVPAHRLLAISQALSHLWPPGPQTIAAPTALVCEALINGSRTLHPVVTVIGDALAMAGVGTMVPTELGQGRVLGRIVPVLSPQERTEILNAIS